MPPAAARFLRLLHTDAENCCHRQMRTEVAEAEAATKTGTKTTMMISTFTNYKHDSRQEQSTEGTFSITFSIGI